MPQAGYRPENVISGTWGEVWIDGDYVAEATGLKANVKLDKEEVKRCRTLAKGYKTTGITCTGSIKFNHVDSKLKVKISNNLKQGKTTVMTIISKLSDPDALGAERIAIKDATFDEVNLADWEVKKLGEESMPFTFSDWDLLDMIE